VQSGEVMRGRRLAIVLALAVANPAQAACADREVASAARLVEFQTMMMAVSLRCLTIGVDMRDDFDAMTTRYNADFSGAGEQVRRFFGVPTKKRGGDYDRYSVVVANKYGGGSTTPRNCRLLNKVVTTVTRITDGGAALVAVAGAMIPRSALEALSCPEKALSGGAKP
jgi:hypothetical protein